MMDSNAAKPRRRTHQLTADQLKRGDAYLNCPRCLRWYVHWRRVSAGQEVFTCPKCGWVQSYNRRDR
jgi:uncharacterized C2H2 Zn-finger protein